MLEDFLHELAQDGVVDSSDTFTVDLARSRSQLFKNQLADPSMYVLKLVQAFVRAGCTSIAVTATASQLQFFAPAADLSGLPTAAVRSALTGNPLSLPDSAVRDLVFGLSTAFALSEGVGVAFIDPELQLETLSVHSSVGFPQRQQCGYQLIFDRFCEDRREGKYLRWCCAFCPIPISWNGKPIQGQVHRWGSNARLMERLIVGSGFTVYPTVWARCTGGDETHPISPLPVLYFRHLVTDGEVKNAHDPRLSSAVACSAAVSIPFDLSGPSQLILVRHGVTLEPLIFSPYYGCEIVLNGDHLPLDLSLFRVREGEELGKMQSFARELLAESALAADGWLAPIASVFAEPPVSGVRGVLTGILFGRPAGPRTPQQSIQIEHLGRMLRKMAQLLTLVDNGDPTFTGDLSRFQAEAVPESSWPILNGPPDYPSQPASDQELGSLNPN